MVLREFTTKKILVLWICVVAVGLAAGGVYAVVVSLPNTPQEGFRVDDGETKTIDLTAYPAGAPCGDCRIVANTSGQSIFIPTKSCAEWNSFKTASLPVGITVSNCVAPFVCGDNLVDTRIGVQTYATVSIGTQCWMKENLNIGTRIDADTDQGNSTDSIQKYCWDNDPNLCDDYGGYYQWHEAMRLNKSCDNNDSCLAQVTYPHQGICPAGWHIPSDVQPDGKPNDWSILETFLTTSGTCNPNRVDSWACDGAGTAMQAVGVDKLEIKLFGSMTSGGWVDNGDEGSSIADRDGHYWSSGATPHTDSDRVWARNFEADGSQASKVQRMGKEKVRGFPVRCVKN